MLPLLQAAAAPPAPPLHPQPLLLRCRSCQHPPGLGAAPAPALLGQPPSKEGALHERHVLCCQHHCPDQRLWRCLCRPLRLQLHCPSCQPCHCLFLLCLPCRPFWHSPPSPHHQMTRRPAPSQPQRQLTRLCCCWQQGALQGRKWMQRQRMSSSAPAARAPLSVVRAHTALPPAHQPGPLMPRRCLQARAHTQRHQRPCPRLRSYHCCCCCCVRWKWGVQPVE
mmetsp:Transcript_5503/g.14853  ORF Transcript_5503/g.14853 Transcript_5503/m.14853 type:complete len:223 (-) Transcript_5503:275-943(-)